MTTLPKHILVIRFSAMGDVAMCVPVLKALIQQYPTVKITVVSRLFFKPIFNDLDNVIFVAADLKTKHKGVFGLYKLYKSLGYLDIDAVADLHNVIRSKILRFFFKMKGVKTVVIDKGRKEKKALTRTNNKIFKQLKTTHNRYADVFRGFGFKLDVNNVKLAAKKDISNTFLVSKNEKWIGIAPFAQHKGKMYPLDLMHKVIANLKPLNAKILLFGGKQELEQLETIASKYPYCVNTAGKLDFSKEIAIISNLDCMLSMDSGNAHLAALYAVPTITLWGATHPFAGFAPFNQEEHCLLPDLEKYPNIPCSIYGTKICEGYQDTMRSIDPKLIVKKINVLIS